jgi:hypothetical protein
MALLTVAQATHYHSDPKEAVGCPLCIAMHTVVPAAVVAAVIVLVPVSVPAPVAKARALIRYWQPQLFTRPPPAGC